MNTNKIKNLIDLKNMEVSEIDDTIKFLQNVKSYLMKDEYITVSVSTDSIRGFDAIEEIKTFEKKDWDKIQELMSETYCNLGEVAGKHSEVEFEYEDLYIEELEEILPDNNPYYSIIGHMSFDLDTPKEYNEYKALMKKYNIDYWF